MLARADNHFWLMELMKIKLPSDLMTLPRFLFDLYGVVTYTGGTNIYQKLRKQARVWIPCIDSNNSSRGRRLFEGGNTQFPCP